MNNLDIISVNIWQILISLLNLVILFLILKRFLFKPVKNMLAKREAEITAEYSRASKTNEEANELKASWEQKMATADQKADEIVKEAVDKAERRNEVMLYETREKAESIIRKARSEAERDKADAKEYIRKEIIDVSEAMSEQVLGREINMDDHRNLIDSFIDNLESDI